jgi:3-dehydroquinate synthase
MEELRLRHPTGETTLFVGAGALAAAAPALATWCAGRLSFLVTTPRVLELHGDALLPQLAPAARLELLTVEEGEAAKSLSRAGALWEQLAQLGGKRDSRLIAFGGGSVGDLAGFVAGCFLRGIELVQVPTTLLAQVDASVGGKTGVDLVAGKNLVGVFHHPTMVLAEPRFLRTLPIEELRSGLAEVIKKGFVLDAALFEQVEAQLPALLAGELEALGSAVAGAVRAKAAVVEADPTEQGERKLLNFGHTLGHALEAADAYRGLRHGEAVAYGMLFALHLALRRGLPPAAAERLRAVLAACGLPPLPRFEAAELTRYMQRDKKAREGSLAWVLPTACGQGRVFTDVSWDEVRSVLERFLADPWFSGA